MHLRKIAGRGENLEANAWCLSPFQFWEELRRTEAISKNPLIAYLSEFSNASLNPRGGAAHHQSQGASRTEGHNSIKSITKSEEENKPEGNDDDGGGGDNQERRNRKGGGLRTRSSHKRRRNKVRRKQKRKLEEKLKRKNAMLKALGQFGLTQAIIDQVSSFCFHFFF